METQSHSTPPPRPRSAPPEAPRHADGESASSHVPPTRFSDPGEPSRHGWVWLLVFIAAVAIAGYFLYPKIAAHLHSQAPTTGQRGPREIAVIAVTARKGNLDLY